MTASNPPAERYLQMVRSLMLGAPQGEGDEWRARFRVHLEELWRRGQEELREIEQPCAMESSPVPAPSPEGVRAGLFVTAVGLFALGRLDVAGFIAGYSRAPTPNLLRLGQVLRELLPLPAAPDTGPWSRERIAAWVAAHAADLRWDESSRRFELSTYPNGGFKSA